MSEQKQDINKSQTQSEAQEKEKKISPYFVIPFFLLLTVLTVVAFIIPLRPTLSYSEKRSLATFPEFSAEALFSGSYFDDITLWFADTFPGRDNWLAFSSRMNELHGFSDIALHGLVLQNDEIPTITIPEATEGTAPPETAAATAASTEPVAPTEPPIKETIAPPTEPVEKWGGVDAGDGADIILGSVIQIGDSAFSYFGFSQYWSDYFVTSVNGLADAVEPNGTKVVSALIPTAVGVLVEKEYLEKLNCTDQEAAIDYMNASMSDKILKVDMFQNLVDHNDEYLYFRTDHHWTALGAYYCYEDICKTLGMEPAPLDSFELWDQGQFMGSLYGKCNQSSKLVLDNVYAYNPPGDLETWITGDNGTFQWTVLTDMSRSSVTSKYMTFIAGDNALTEIINHDIPDAPVCVLVKDSFGNPLAPFLTQNFSTVYVIDFRKYFKMNLRSFAETYDVDYIIFGHTLAMAQTEGANSLLGWLCGH